MPGSDSPGSCAVAVFPDTNSTKDRCHSAPERPAGAGHLAPRPAQWRPLDRPPSPFAPARHNDEPDQRAWPSSRRSRCSMPARYVECSSQGTGAPTGHGPRGSTDTPDHAPSLRCGADAQWAGHAMARTAHPEDGTPFPRIDARGSTAEQRAGSATARGHRGETAQAKAPSESRVGSDAGRPL